jgi:GNAT superfamily N-acetyltransferase
VGYSISWTENAEDTKQLQQNLMSEIQSKFGAPERVSFAWVVHDTKQQLIGGVSGFAHWKWSYVTQLWVSSSEQGKGLGSKLICQVEDWSRSRHYQGVYIDTFEKKVMHFYEKLGYQLMGQIPDFPEGSNRYFLYNKF